MDSIPQKSCTACGMHRPRSEFYSRPTTQDGLAATCKDCQRAYARAYRREHYESVKAKDKHYRDSGARDESNKKRQGTAFGRERQALSVKNGVTKACYTCKIVKGAREYYYSPSSTDGLQAECKECAKKRVRDRVAANPEAKKNYDRLYRVANREKRREAWKRYLEEMPPEKKQARVERRKSQAEQRKASLPPKPRTKSLLSKEQEAARAKEWARRYAERRKRILAAGHGATAEEWKLLLDWFGDSCLQCGRTESIQRDHVVPVTLGGRDHITNLQPLCGLCNRSKGTSIADYRDPNKLKAFLLHVRKLTDM